MMRRVFTAFIVLIALSSHAAAGEMGAAKRGATLAQSVCAQCHAVRADQLRSPNPMAPSFMSVADTPGMTDRALRVWLQSSHPTMPNFILNGKEQGDIIIYILNLEGRKIGDVDRGALDQQARSAACARKSDCADA